MKRTQRLRRHGEFQKVFSDGRSWANRYLVVNVLPSGEKKVGICVGRSLGNAVVRNRIRRRLRELVRKHWEEFPDNAWIVLIARGSCKRAPFREIEQGLKNALAGVAKHLTREQGAGE